MCRRACRRITKAYSSRNPMVGTTRKSIAAIPAAWLRRKVLQVWDDGRPPLTMYLATVVSPTSMPSLSSSPWMRGAPQSGLARLITRISWRVSREIFGRPQGDRELPAPVQPEAPTMPAQHRCRLYDADRIPERGIQPIKPNEEHSVHGCHAKPRPGRTP